MGDGPAPPARRTGRGLQNAPPTRIAGPAHRFFSDLLVACADPVTKDPEYLETGQDADSNPVDTADSIALDTGDSAPPDLGCPVVTELGDAYASAYGFGDNRVGLSLAAGDLDGDGALDLGIGGWVTYTLAGPIAEGESDLRSSASAYLWEERGNPGFALAVGDEDGDGQDDLIVGDQDGERAFLVRGPVSGEYDLASRLDAFVFSDYPHEGTFSDSVNLDGDFDGDGRRDPVVTDSHALDEWGNRTGRAYLLTEPLDTYVNADLEATATYAGRPTAILSAVTGASDLDGDGVDDLALSIGASLDVHFSAMDLDSFGEMVSISFDYAPTHMDLGSDLNGDGHPDLVVAETSIDEAVSGVVWVVPGPLLGSVGARDVALFNVYATVSPGLGDSVSAGGDFTGDGISDVIIGDYAIDAEFGRIYVVSGTSVGSVDASVDTLTVLGGPDDLLAGYDVLAGPDWTGDGLSDIAVSASLYDGGLGRAGMVYILCGGVW